MALDSLPARVRDRIDAASVHGCWLWTGRLDRNGYATQVRVGAVRSVAHRAVWLMLRGPIPDGLELDHAGCAHRHCVNPDHLEPVTKAENIARSEVGRVNRAKTTCPQGHALAGANLVLVRRGQAVERGCRRCRRDAQRRYIARQGIAA